MLQIYNSIEYMQAGEAKIKETLQSICFISKVWNVLLSSSSKKIDPILH